MKYSELDITKLSDEDIYDLVMTGIVDYAGEKPTEKTNPDFLVVLGCSPIPLKARVVKMMHLYKEGYGKYILFSGGKGWHKLFQVDKSKAFKNDKERETYLKTKTTKLKAMKKALKETLGEEVKPDKNNPYKHRKELKKLLRKPEALIANKIMRAAQESCQIEDDKVFYEPNSNNTVQNLENSRQILDELQRTGKVGKIKRIMIITSSFHCRRAELSFEKYFPDVEVISCPATIDIEKAGISFNKEDLMRNPYYMQQFRNELNAIINYTRNGSIEDLKIETILGEKRADEIRKKAHNLEQEH